MVPAKNLHWLIKAQLAKRGGHRSHVRIAPDAVPGYIAYLRETNQAGDGSNKREAPLAWKPKPKPGKAPKTDGDSSTTLSAFVNPEAWPIPSDFVDVGFTVLENDLNALVSGSDDWSVPIEPDAVIPWHDRSVLTDRQVAIETWWDKHQPQLHIDIEPCVMFRMGKSGEPFSRESLVSALTSLSEMGSSKQRLPAAEALLVTGSRGGGFKRETQSYWGVVHRHGDFAAQELTVACFHFHVIDFGDSIPSTAALMRSTGSTVNVERGQCVLLRLAAGLFGSNQGERNEYRVGGESLCLLRS